VVSAHLETCASCRAQVARFEEAEGRLIDALPPATLPADALERVLARLDSSDAGPTNDLTDTVGDVKLPFAAARAGVGPRRWLAPGFWAAPIQAAVHDDWRSFVLRAPARTVIPTHGHDGGELIAVLSGSFQDGQRYRAGDFAESIAHSEHALRVSADGPCACLIAVQGRIKWHGWSRMIRPLLGI
jgi:putative transcriptional regulator